jgi:hypothetical protein
MDEEGNTQAEGPSQVQVRSSHRGAVVPQSHALASTDLQLNARWVVGWGSIADITRNRTGKTALMILRDDGWASCGAARLAGVV